MRRNLDFGNDPLRGDSPNLIGAIFREPEIAVWLGGNLNRNAACGRYREFGYNPLSSNPPDLINGVLREPEIPIRASDDACRKAASGWSGELSYYASRGNAPDIAETSETVLRCKPEVAVRPRGDAVRPPGIGRDRILDNADGEGKPQSKLAKQHKEAVEQGGENHHVVRS